MKYPQAADYHLAIQAPAAVFRDPVLRASKVRTDPLGMPLVSSGGFALTYYLDAPGDVPWVVRCFKVDVTDRQSRYAAIGQFLDGHRQPVFTTVEYIEDGILVNGQRYPVVKMPFVRGETLHRYIERNLAARRALAVLPDQFSQLVNTLDRLRVAHGDLQHGNILVDNGQLVLVDYDGMYVPALDGRRSAESGHRSYQHPARTDQFAADLDRFSAIVIHLALTAVVRSPGLWKKYSNGDNLLFVEQDFRTPHKSRLLAELEVIPELAGPVANLRTLCQAELSAIPRLDDFWQGKLAPPVQPGRRTAPSIGVGAAARDGDASLPLDATNRTQLLNHLGDRAWVVGLISQLRKATTVYGDPYLFLNFGEYRDGCMTLVIWGDSLKLFGSQGIRPESYLGRWVSVRGLLTAYEALGGPKQPQIVVDLPSQIEVLAGGAAEGRTLLAQSAAVAVTTPAEADPAPRTLAASPAALPALALSNTAVDFGEVAMGQEKAARLTVTNAGREVLEVEAISLRPWLKIAPSRIRCQPGASRSFVVTLYSQGIPATLLQPEAGPGSPARTGLPMPPRRHRLHDARVYLSAQQVVTPVEVSALLAGRPAPAVRHRAPQQPEPADELAPDWRRILVGISVGVGVMAAVWMVLALLFLL